MAECHRSLCCHTSCDSVIEYASASLCKSQSHIWEADIPFNSPLLRHQKDLDKGSDLERQVKVPESAHGQPTISTLPFLGLFVLSVLQLPCARPSLPLDCPLPEGKACAGLNLMSPRALASQSVHAERIN